MIFLIRYIFPLLFAFSGERYHPIHVSVLNIEYNLKKSTVDMSLKVYTADLELAIAHNYNIALNLGKPNEISSSVAKLQPYMSASLKLTINNLENQQIQIKSKENDGEATRLFFSIPVVGKLKNLLIKDLMLMDVFEDQTNLVIVVLNGKEQGYRQTYGSKDINITI